MTLNENTITDRWTNKWMDNAISRIAFVTKKNSKGLTICHLFITCQTVGMMRQRAKWSAEPGGRCHGITVLQLSLFKMW